VGAGAGGGKGKEPGLLPGRPGLLLLPGLRCSAGRAAGPSRPIGTVSGLSLHRVGPKAAGNGPVADAWASCPGDPLGGCALCSCKVTSGRGGRRWVCKYLEPWQRQG